MKVHIHNSTTPNRTLCGRDTDLVISVPSFHVANEENNYRPMPNLCIKCGTIRRGASPA